MSSISRASTAQRHATTVRLTVGVLLLLVVSLLLASEAWAIDGNYSSPYASQYDSRSTAAAIPNETWLGILLLVVNLALAAAFSQRARRRRGNVAR